MGSATHWTGVVVNLCTERTPEETADGGARGEGTGGGSAPLARVTLQRRGIPQENPPRSAGMGDWRGVRKGPAEEMQRLYAGQGMGTGLCISGTARAVPPAHPAVTVAVTVPAHKPTGSICKRVRSKGGSRQTFLSAPLWGCHAPGRLRSRPPPYPT